MAKASSNRSRKAAGSCSRSALCSVLTLYLIGDGSHPRDESAKAAAARDRWRRVRDLFRAGKYVDAYNYCKEHPSAFTQCLPRRPSAMLGEGKIGGGGRHHGGDGQGKFAHADLHLLPLGDRRLHADDRAARHGHGHDQRLRRARRLAASAIPRSFPAPSAKCSSPRPRASSSPSRPSAPFISCAIARRRCCTISRTPWPGCCARCLTTSSPARTSATTNSTRPIPNGGTGDEVQEAQA